MLTNKENRILWSDPTWPASQAIIIDPMMQRMPKVPAPRAYLDGLDADDPATGLHYANMLEAKILEEGPDTVLAFIVEPVGGASTGALVPPAGYMQRIREICTQYGVLLIHDEVMTGGGRTGRFFGAEHWDVKPDLISISKGFGGGYVPLGAMIARDDIVEAVMAAGGFMLNYQLMLREHCRRAPLSKLILLDANLSMHLNCPKKHWSDRIKYMLLKRGAHAKD